MFGEISSSIIPRRVIIEQDIAKTDRVASHFMQLGFSASQASKTNPLMSSTETSY